MSILRQVIVSYDCNDRVGSRSNSQYFNSGVSDGVVELGSVTINHPKGILMKQQPLQFAKSNDDMEKKCIASIVGEGDGTIVVSWPSYLNDILDENVLSAKEEFLTREQIRERAKEEEEEASKKKTTGVAIMDCIEKYCELEQLEESNMWYCNKCKVHVRAWKQVSLYRTLPILIVHLKRFHFSSNGIKLTH